MCHCKAVFLIVVSAKIAQSHYFPIQVSVLLGINWPLYQTTYNSPNMFNEGNIFEIFPNLFPFFSNLAYFPAAFSPSKTKVGEYEENNNKKIQRKSFSKRKVIEQTSHECLVLNSSTHLSEVC